MERFAAVRTIDQAITVESPSLGELMVHYGDKKTAAMLKMWIINLNESINTTRKFKGHQIDEAALLIMQGYRNISIADMTLIFKNAKSGVYGDIYETLSMHKLLAWFREYFDDRMEAFERRSLENHDRQKYKEEKEGDAVSPEFFKVIQDIRENLKADYKGTKKFNEEEFRKYKQENAIHGERRHLKRMIQVYPKGKNIRQVLNKNK